MFRLRITYRKHHGKVHEIPRFIIHVHIPVITIYTRVTHPGDSSHKRRRVRGGIPGDTHIRQG